MNKSIKALIILSFSCLIILQCKKYSAENNILYHKENPYFSFYIKDKKNVFYGAPYKSEKPISISSSKKLLFDEYLTKFIPYELPKQKALYDKIFVSIILGESNFSNNNQFEYEMSIEKDSTVKVNIFYPDEYVGSYIFNIDSLTMDMLCKAIYKLNTIEIDKKEISNLSNIIILNINNQEKIYGGKNMIYNNPEYSFILTLSNKLLLENINSKTTKIQKNNFPTQQYVNHISLPQLPKQRPTR